MRRQTLTELSRNPNLISESTTTVTAGVNAVLYRLAVCYTQRSRKTTTTHRKAATSRMKLFGGNSVQFSGNTRNGHGMGAGSGADLSDIKEDDEPAAKETSQG
jgi:hypothetical protein